MATSDTIIAVNDVDHSYGGAVKALSGIDLTIRRGEFVAIIGKNGSGKTTLAKHFNGLLKPSNTAGRVFLYPGDDRPIDTRRSRLYELAPIVGYVFQNPDRQIFHDTCREELEYGPRNLKADEHTLGRAVTETLELVGLEGREDANPIHLSRGERQRLAIASTLIMGCDVVVVDEPTTGQDRAESRKILDSLAHHHRRGQTIVIVSHDMALVAEYATRVIAMRNGRVLTDGTPRDVFSQREVLQETNIRPPQAAVLGSELGLPGILTVDDAVQAMLADARRLTSARRPTTRGAH